MFVRQHHFFIFFTDKFVQKNSQIKKRTINPTMMCSFAGPTVQIKENTDKERLFLRKVHRSVLGLVGLIDAKAINVP